MRLITPCVNALRPSLSVSSGSFGDADKERRIERCTGIERLKDHSLSGLFLVTAIRARQLQQKETDNVLRLNIKKPRLLMGLFI